jgi:hypothetical protein
MFLIYTKEYGSIQGSPQGVRCLTSEALSGAVAESRVTGDIACRSML